MSLGDVHTQLRVVMIDAGADQIIARDEPGDLVLHTKRHDPKTDKPDWFGAVALKKGYVAYHLLALYHDPSLGAGMSDALARRRHGKSCFNFKTIDPALLAELAELTRRANREIWQPVIIVRRFPIRRVRETTRASSESMVKWESGLFKPAKVSGQACYATLLDPDGNLFNLIQR